MKKGLSGIVLGLLIVFCLNQPVQLASLKGIASGVADGVLCEACSVIVDTIQKLAQLHFSESLIEKAAIEACEKFNLADDRICKLIIPEFKVILMSLLCSVYYELLFGRFGKIYQ